MIKNYSTTLLKCADEEEVGEVSPALISVLALAQVSLLPHFISSEFEQWNHLTELRAAEAIRPATVPEAAITAPTRWNEFIIDVDFRTVCRDEGALSTRVLNACSPVSLLLTCRNIWSRLPQLWRCYKANKQTYSSTEGWPSHTLLLTCSPLIIYVL